MKNTFLMLVGLLCLTQASAQVKAEKKADDSFTNPVIHADFPDLSVTRKGGDYYLISTTMHLMPGAPILKSNDLVNWEIKSYVFDSIKDSPKYDLIDGESVYGRGQWASSIRYHKGKFYTMFATNDPSAGYIYSTTNPEGKWERVSRVQQFHDPSLFFDDDDKVYVFSGTGSLRELKSDLSGVQPGGVDMHFFEKDASETNLLEGSQAFKYKGKYYVVMISWPGGKLRREVCYRADKITGPYEKKVILEKDFANRGGVGQGCLIDTEDGRWFGLLFQDRGAVGRVPVLVPVRWEDGWPMLGDATGSVPLTMEKPIKGAPKSPSTIVSDQFSASKLSLCWQWNHNPNNAAWSLTERKGYMRLKTNRVVSNIFVAPNTLTQRMEGLISQGTICMDVSKMKDGDVAGLSAFCGDAGLLSVVMEGGKKFLVMSTTSIVLDNKKKVNGEKAVEKERVELSKNVVYLRVYTDFSRNKDLATFSYSLDNKTWKTIGSPAKMIFNYRTMFMGTRYGIYNYATKELGGFVDVDFFKHENIQNYE
jgi:beta-xylosidase